MQSKLLSMRRALKPSSCQLLHAIIDGTSAVTGNDFFKSLVQHLAKGLGVRYSFVTECIANNRVRSLAFWNTDAFTANSEYDLNGTPCLVAIEGRTVHYERHLQGFFPADKALVEMSAESYLGVPQLPQPKMSAPATAARDASLVTWFGARLRTIRDQGEMSAFGLPGVTGVLVLEAPTDSILAQAGLRKDDVILSVNGAVTADTAALLRQTSTLPPGTSIKLGLCRDQKEVVVQLIP
jgi:hypothetical protein